ncbi:hypothetical protein ONE63_007748 [Megalurothrips usitatus]|uniref:Lipocalin/cytosolic fatty-acid binding domain-containing protein n=1 Tax=Megalurothrips usitatus TaxID=439358 RepID=A0AAV7XNM6_9NEOP|nr:hypothetical protein ONE63_007748 [Megalurothrips usitatus]
MFGLRTAVLLAALCGVAIAQIPSLGWCPDYVPMAEFNMERYLGTWYEAERYFTVLEAGSRCVSTNYTKAVDGRVLVSNQITNRLTGIKRVVEGEIRNVVKGAESKLNVKYSTLPVPFETTYSVLDTDYDSYAVVWSCSSIGPLRTQNAWVMTRERLAPGTVLQMAYGVLDKYKISRTFFVKTDQADCAIAEAAAEEAQRKAAAEAAAAEKSAVAEPAAAPIAAAAAPIAAAAPAPIAAAPIVPAIPVAAAPAAAPAPIIPEAAIPAIPAIPAVNIAQAAAPAEKAADPVAPIAPVAAAAAAPAAPIAPIPAAPFVPIPIAQQLAAAPAAAPDAAPVAAVVPVVAAAPVAPAAPLVPVIAAAE